MNKNDYPAFCDLWANANEASANGRQLSKGAMSMIFESLEHYPLEAIKTALRLNSQKNKFAPTPADIVEIIDSHTASKHIGSDEAWSIALESFDEDATVAVTQQIIEAKAIAQDVYMAGDTTGARMAFRAAYERTVKTSAKPVWSLSLGNNPKLRADGARRAVLAGRISETKASPYLIDYTPTVTVAGLIEQSMSKVDAVEKIKAIKQLLDKPEHTAISDREKERLDFEATKAQTMKKVEEIIGAIH